MTYAQFNALFSPRRQLALFVVLLLVIFGLSFCTPAAAAGKITGNSTVGREYQSNGSRYVGTRGAESVTWREIGNRPVAEKGIEVFERWASRVGGNSIVVAGARRMAAQAIARNVVNVGAAAWAGCEVGSQISLYLSGTRVSCDPLDWLVDDGVPAGPGSYTYYSCQTNQSPLFTAEGGNPSGCASALGPMVEAYRNSEADVSKGSCKSYTTYKFSGPVPRSGSIYLGFITQTYIVVAPCSYGPPTSGFSDGVGVIVSQPKVRTSDSVCPVDPATGLPFPADGFGVCPTGNYRPAGPNDNIVDMMEKNSPADAQRNAVEDLIRQGVDVDGASDYEVTGPATAVGEPTVQTETRRDSQGNVTTTITTTTTPITNYYYSGDTITHTTTPNVKVETCTGGVCTTTETGTEVPEPKDPDPKPDEPAKDPCEGHPERAGCVDLGTDTTKVVWGEQMVFYTPFDFGVTGSCPPPEVWVVHGFELTMDYSVLCTNAPVIRLAMIALASLGALFMILRSI